MNATRYVRSLAVALSLGALAACSSGGRGSASGGTSPPPTATTYTVGGTVSGLESGEHLALQDNGGDELTVGANGGFTFSTGLAGGAAYAVTVLTQPTGETCSTSSASGTVGAADVDNIGIICSAIPTFTVTAQVTGLVGTIGLELNGGPADDATITGSTAKSVNVTFSTKLAGGASYTVTVSTQPSGYTCTPGDSSGTVGSADVTVTVACASSGGGGGGSGFWLPFSAAPVTGTSGGKSGLFLIASHSIANSPAPSPQFVTTSTPTLLGLSLAGFVSGGALPASETPAAMIYAAAGSDGNAHVYGLSLAYSSSSPPAPVQLTNLSVPPPKVICQAGQVESNLADPSSLEVVVYVVTPQANSQAGQTGYCGGGGGSYYLVHYADSAATAPMAANIPGGTSALSALENDGIFSALYEKSGALGGIVLWNARGQSLNFYANATFASPTVLLGGVTGTTAVFSRTTLAGASYLGGGDYLVNVTSAAGTAAYRVSSAGAVTRFFDGDVGSAVADDSNLYFIGTAPAATTSDIYEEPLTFSGTATQLFSKLPAMSASAASSLLWSNDSALLFENYSASGGGTESYSLESIPIGAPSASATVISGPDSGVLVTSFMASPTGTDTAADILFTSTLNQSGATAGYSSQVMTAGGTLEQSASNTVIASFGTLSTELAGDVYEISGITDTSGSYGGGTVELLNVGSLAGTPMTTTDGAAYTLPAGYLISMFGFYNTNIAVGTLLSRTPAVPEIGTAVDVSKHCILPIALANTNVAAFL
jgi:hypothetical protein